MSPDTVLKNYWSGNEEFADLFNAVLFNGKQVIIPNELENEDTEASVVLVRRNHMQGIKAARDNIKIQKKSTVYGVQFVLLGLESQEHIHYAMPLRVMGYDYATYKKQYDNNARQYQDVSSGILNIPMDQNNSIRDKKEKAIEYTKEHKVSDTILQTVAGAASCKIDFDTLKQKGGNNMWSVFEETAKEGKAEGKAEGIIDTCSDLGLPDEDILKRLQVKMGISLQAAQEYLRMFRKKTV